VIPFIMIQLLLLVGLAIWPQLVMWLPAQIYN
jgi:TRAP-type mannitol/chloroaromatic compound transport system permease large subunit